MTAEGALGPPGVFAGGTTGRAMAVRTPAFKAASCLAYVELAPTAGTSTTSATPSSQTLPTKPTIYLCLPAPVYQTRWGINEKTVKEGVIPVIRKVAKDEGLTVIDLYQALSGKPALFPDKIHPNAAGAKLMAQTIHTVLRKKH